MRISNQRYIAHELGDPYIAGIVGWLAGMLQNQNNIVEEVSPVTSKMEKEVVKNLATMLGLGSGIWGHLTSGGTPATIEALWVARNKTYFPYIIAEFASDENIDLNSHVLVSTKKETLADLASKAIRNPRLSSDLYEGLNQVVGKQFSGAKKKGNEVIKRLWQNYGITGKGWQSANLPVGKVLVSKAAHYSIIKAVDLLGIGNRNLVQLPVDTNSRLDCEELRLYLEKGAKLAQGDEKVIAMVANLGTTATGSVDPLDQILAIRNSTESKYQTSFIIHADAAYGGYAGLVDWDSHGLSNGPALKRRFEAISKADSVTIDPHKLGYVPYPCGSVIFRDHRDKEFVKSEAPYLFHESKPFKSPSLDEIEFLGQFTMEGSKPGSAATSALLAHKSARLSTGGHGSLLTKNIKMTRYLEALIDKSEVLAKVNSSELNILCVRIKNRSGSKEKTVQIYRKLLKNHTNGDFVVSHEENDLFGPCFRICLLNPFVTKEILREFVTKLESMVEGA